MLPLRGGHDRKWKDHPLWRKSLRAEHCSEALIRSPSGRSPCDNENVIGTGRLGEKQLASADNVYTDFLDNMTFRVLDGKKRPQRHRQVCRNLALFIFRGEVEENDPPGPHPLLPPYFFVAPLLSCPLQSANVQLSWVTLRVPDGREVMIPVSTTDGSVTAGGNTLIVRSYSAYIFSPVYIKALWHLIWETPASCFTATDLFWVLWPAAGLRVLRVAQKSIKLPLARGLVTICWNVLCGLEKKGVSCSTRKATWKLIVSNVLDVIVHNIYIGCIAPYFNGNLFVFICLYPVELHSEMFPVLVRSATIKVLPTWEA